MSAANRPMTKAAQKNAELLQSMGLYPNPQYGHGCLHRKILLRKQGNTVLADLEDNCHVFRVRLTHDNKTVAAVSGEALRYPNNTCPGSLELLQRLVGVTLGGGPGAFAKSTNAREFCTHLFDLACLAYTHASRHEEIRLYHAMVRDEDDNSITDALALIDGKPAVHWHLKQHIVQDDNHFKGVNVHSGFTRWAMTHLEGDELEAAIVLSKTNFVSMSRRVDTEKVAGTQLVNGIMPKDICFTYRSPVMETAFHLENTTRDYSDTPDEMLKFVELP